MGLRLQNKNKDGPKAPRHNKDGLNALNKTRTSLRPKTSQRQNMNGPKA